ncbi:MAG: Maf family nucleotide pyrophosphatase [Eudoraea sp.]|uniref:Maf family nucleotide pyrophosphatase n=1 Tax=Eudoraea sp. TaxID=1979955 RepID=UPI003C784983
MTDKPKFINNNGHKIILASGSPRRQELLKQMGFDFEINLKSIPEIYPEDLKGSEIALYLAKLKASPFLKSLQANEIVITADTVVWHQNRHLSKAADKEEAIAMLKSLSDCWHEVITAVCFSSLKQQKLVHEVTKVKFKKLSENEILHYVKNYQPFDKAGAYGIQEWLGLIGIEEIKGSYTNVVGLPTQSVYNCLSTLLTEE